MTNPPNTRLAEREQIARIIDPGAWIMRDRCLAAMARHPDMANGFREDADRHVAKCLAKADAILSALLREQDERIEKLEGDGERIKEVVAEGDGCWRSCSGCLELEDGQNVHGYPHSATFGCTLGGGCSECGGLGAIWDTTDYAAMADEIARSSLASKEGSAARDLSDANAKVAGTEATPKSAAVVDRSLDPLDSYAIGLLNEEAGEIVQEVGKTLRFGLDTPSPVNSRYNGTTPRERLTDEIGDMQAAIWFAHECGLIDQDAVDRRAVNKLALHRDPDFRNLAVWPPASGRELPRIADGSDASVPNPLLSEPGKGGVSE